MRYRARKQITHYRSQINESWTGTEGRARVRAGVVQADGEHASTGTVGPVAATEEYRLNS